MRDDSATITKSNLVAETHIETTARFGNANIQATLNKFLHSINNTQSINQLNSMLTCMSSVVKTGGASRGKISCQPISMQEDPQVGPEEQLPSVKDVHQKVLYRHTQSGLATWL